MAGVPAAISASTCSCGCRQDHPDREAPPVRGCDPAGRLGEGAPGRPPRHVRLDGDGAGAGDLRDVVGPPVPVRRLPGQPARYAWPPGLLGGHLPDADRGGQRRHAPGQSEGRRGTDAQALQGLQATAHAHLHLRQQVRPIRRGAAEAARRRRSRARHRLRAVYLAHHQGRPVSRRVRPAGEGSAAL